MSIVLLQSCGGTIKFRNNGSDKNKVQPTVVDKNGNDSGNITKDGEVVAGQSQDEGAVRPDIVNGSVYLYCETPITKDVKSGQSSAGCIIADPETHERINLANIQHEWNVVVGPNKKHVEVVVMDDDDRPSYFQFAFKAPLDRMKDLTVTLASGGNTPAVQELAAVINNNNSLAALINSNDSASSQNSNVTFGKEGYFHIGDGQIMYSECYEALKKTPLAQPNKEKIGFKFRLSKNSEIKVSVRTICGISFSGSTISLKKVSDQSIAFTYNLNERLRNGIRMVDTPYKFNKALQADDYELVVQSGKANSSTPGAPQMIDDFLVGDIEISGSENGILDKLP